MTQTQAFEVVCSDSDPQWLEERRKLVTGSTAAQLLGVNRFGSLLGTYLRMRGAPGEVVDDERRLAMDWGTDQQDAIVANIRRRLDLQAERTGVFLRSVQWPWIGCTLDGWVEVWKVGRTRGLQVPFEVKATRSRDAADEWGEGVPVDVMPQVQTQMLVTGVSRSLVAAVIFGAPPAFIWVDRDEEMIEEIIERSHEFMLRVERGEPPDPDGSEDAGAALAASPREKGKSVELDIEAVMMAEELATLDAKRKALDRLIEQRKQRLIVKLRDAEVGRLPGGGRVTYKTQSRRGYTKLPPIEDIEPGLAARLKAQGLILGETPSSSFRVLRRSKK